MEHTVVHSQHVTTQRIDDGRFATADLTDDGNELTTSHSQVNTFQCDMITNCVGDLIDLFGLRAQSLIANHSLFHVITFIISIRESPEEILLINLDGNF